MKCITTRSFLMSCLVLMAVIIFCSCNRKFSFEDSQVVPAARGYVKVTRDKNKNYKIEVSVSDLAEVGRLEGNNNSYVVWMASSDNASKNIGQIKSREKGFSRKLRASFHTVTSEKPDKVFITAEEDGSVQYPNGRVVLTTRSM